MSTIHQFNDVADIGAAIASDDQILVKDTSLGQTTRSDASRLNTLVAGAATAAEIARNTDVSTRMIAAGSTLTLTEASHEGKIIALDTAAGSTVTLPDATGGGGVYRFLITVTATSNSHIIKVANATDEMRGSIMAATDAAGAPINTFTAADNDDTITFNRTTTGTAAQGHWVECVDATNNHWFVRGFIEQSGTEATPFSNTVS